MVNRRGGDGGWLGWVRKTANHIIFQGMLLIKLIMQSQLVATYK